MQSYQKSLIDSLLGHQEPPSPDNEYRYIYSFGEDHQYTFMTSKKINDPRLRRRSSAKRSSVSKAIDEVLAIADDYLIVLDNGSLGLVYLDYSPMPRLGSLEFFSSDGVTFGKRMSFRKSIQVVDILSQYDEGIVGEEMPLSSKVKHLIQTNSMKWKIGSYDGKDICIILEPEDYMEVKLNM